MLQQALSHIIIEEVTPAVDSGRYPAKHIMGEPCIVEADIFRDGHQKIHAAILYRQALAEDFRRTPMWLLDNDRWRGQFIPDRNSRYVFTIEAWTDHFGSWLSDLQKKVAAGRDVGSDLLEGLEIIEQAAGAAAGEDRQILTRCALALRKSKERPHDALEIATQQTIAEIIERVAARPDVACYQRLLELIVDRPKARFSTWYEMFPRGQSTRLGKPSTLREAEGRLPGISQMGFDVVYLPPVHPIGVTNRKGPDNTLDGGASSPGSPWAIGNAAGGHDAIDPGLGTQRDFDHFVAAANILGIETAIDFAVQCSPDHPWVREHPDWFSHRPDGSIKYAENPPKEYQDIYPINFDTPDRAALYAELLRIVKFWIARGIRIFRVDNPHTKPVAFWEWLIAQVQSEHPDVLFLAEAFTRPKMMKVLAKAGFSQSYTYFTWRNSKEELTEYLTEITQPPMRDYFRPNFFTNTPDILPPILQTGGRPAFKMRLVLAATLAASYGIYSGFELCESDAVSNTEEYRNSEKYEIKVRDWYGPGNIREFIARVNEIRKNNPALHDFANLRFLHTDSDQILFYSKSSPNRNNILLVAVNLDPHTPHYCTAFVPPEAVGVRPGQSYRVRDLLTDASYTWTEQNYVRLDPSVEPAHILRVEASV
jgi:starch synthase (maltosyl-transferring)